MAVIRPFLGMRFQSSAGSLDRLIAPYSEDLTPTQRDGYAERSGQNVVHLSLPEAEPEDRSKYIRYARSAARLAQWRREGLLAVENRPALYRVTQKTQAFGTSDTHAHMSLVALLRVTPYDRGMILEGEPVVSRAREDRLRLLEATRAHFEPSVGLLEDAEDLFGRLLADAPVGEGSTVTTDEGVEITIEPIFDESTIRAIQKQIAGYRTWICSGEASFQATVAFRDALGERTLEVPEDYALVALSARTQPSSPSVKPFPKVPSGLVFWSLKDY